MSTVWDTPPTEAEIAASQRKAKPQAKTGIRDTSPTEAETTAWARAQAPDASAAGGFTAAARGFLQGATFGFADELSAAGDAAWDALTTDKSYSDAYADNLEAYRVRHAASQDESPVAYGAGELTGAVAGAGKIGKAAGAGLKVIAAGTGKAAQLAGQASRLAAAATPLQGAVAGGAAEGALYGLGNSEGEDTAWEVVKNTALGAAGAGIGHKLGQAVQGLRPRAVAGLKKADAIADGRATQETLADVASRKGTSHAERQKASRFTENIRRIPGDEALETTNQAILKREAAFEALANRYQQLEAQAAGKGLTDDVLDQGGEWLSKGSKLDKAQKARREMQDLEDAAARLADEIQQLRAGSLHPLELESRAAARQELMKSSKFKVLESEVLGSSMEQADDQLARMQAADAAYRAAAAKADENIAKRAAELKSPKSALTWGKNMALRYGPPLLGSMVGAEYGGVAGAGIGLAAGGAAGALGALAGAGMRPAIQAVKRGVTENPAVMTAFYGGLKRLTAESPEKLGRWGSVLGRALARGDSHFNVTIRLIQERDPEFRAWLREAQESDNISGGHRDPE